MDRVRKGLTLLPYKASRQLLQISYVSIFVVPPKLLMSVPLLRETLYLHYARISYSIPIESIGKKKKQLRAYDSSGKTLKKKKLKIKATYRDKLSTEAAIY